jgi:hypothetical protein
LSRLLSQNNGAFPCGHCYQDSFAEQDADFTWPQILTCSIDRLCVRKCVHLHELYILNPLAIQFINLIDQFMEQNRNEDEALNMQWTVFEHAQVVSHMYTFPKCQEHAKNASLSDAGWVSLHSSAMKCFMQVVTPIGVFRG